MHARPNMNGNTRDDFLRVAREINRAATDAEEALKSAHEVVNGRNYQTVENGAEAQRADVERLHAAYAAARNMRDLAVEIYDAAKGG